MAFARAQWAFKQAAFAVCLGLLAPIHTFADGTRLSLPNRIDGPVELQFSQPLGKASPTDVLRVYVGQSDICCEGKTPIAGRYTVDDGKVTFAPIFPFLEGQDYTVQTRLGSREQSTASELTDFSIAADKVPPMPKVTAIYPSGSALPENVLRFYIHFSTPMMPHISEHFIALINENGEADKAAFMSFKQELWNADRTRLTLLMDPGRIKRGVARNQELGPALNKGKSYTLVVKEGWRAALSGITAEMFHQRFEVSEPLRSLPDPRLWRINAPRSGTMDDVSIRFDRTYDRQMALSTISIVKADGTAISGTISLEDHETTWRFRPDEEWPSSPMEVHVDARLEDVAGNNLKELLDHPLGALPRAQDRIKLPIKLKEQKQ